MGRVRRPVPRSRIPLHRLLRNHPDVLRRWLVVALVGGSTALLVGRTISQAEAARSRWGTTTSVLVATAPIRSGSPMEERVELRRWPVAVAPPGSLGELDPGATAAVDIDVGMPITAAAVQAPGGDADRIRVAVPLDASDMELREGDHVDLWSTVDPTFAAVSGSRGVVTERVAVRARVTADSGTGHVVVAVEVDEGAAVVEALATSTVTPVLVA